MRLQPLSASAGSGLLLSAVLAGCSQLAGPDYQRPTLPAKDDWSLTAPAELTVSDVVRPDWWIGFDDRELDRFIRQALVDNSDVAILGLRIDQASIGLEEERAGRLPTFGLDIGASVNRSATGTTESYSVNSTGLNWEIDIWGKAQKAIRAKRAAYAASEADYRAGYLTLVSEVASTYFALRLADEKLRLQQDALDRNRTILAIFQKQLEEGIIPATKLLQQRAEVRDLEQRLVDAQRLRQISANRLATLLGRPAGSLDIAPGALTRTLAPVPAGLPAELLRRRPDVLAAEYRVLQAHELIGEARLAKLPSISLTGSGGLAGAALSALLGGGTLGLAASINIPIFDPKLQLAVENRSVEAEIAAEEYRKTVLTAFEEVENALVNLDSRLRQREALRERRADLALVNATVQMQLREGEISQLEVLESERSLLSLEESLVQLQSELLGDIVTLYKALGGGWSEQDVDPAALDAPLVTSS